MTSPIPKKATEAATSPPPVPSYMRRTGPSPAERNYAAVAESLARDALQAKKEAAAMRARALRAEDLLALAVRRPPTAAWREAAPPVAAPGRPRSAAASTCGPAVAGASKPATSTSNTPNTPTSRGRRRALRADDAEPAAAALWCRRPPRLRVRLLAAAPANWLRLKPVVGAYCSIDHVDWRLVHECTSYVMPEHRKNKRLVRLAVVDVALRRDRRVRQAI